MPDLDQADRPAADCGATAHTVGRYRLRGRPPARVASRNMTDADGMMG